MKERAGKTVAIYASVEHAARMEWAKKLGINVSAIANAIWDKHLARELEKAKTEKQKEIREALSAPMP